MADARKTSEPRKPKRPPATTREGRENQLISLAVDLAEQQLIDGTASAQVITHYLKLATPREGLERDKLQSENKLLTAKTESLASAKNLEVLMEDAIKAMTRYQGGEVEMPDDED